MGELARDLIYIRSTNTHTKITDNPNRFHAYFEGYIGALDGTHVKACTCPHGGQIHLCIGARSCTPPKMC